MTAPPPTILYVIGSLDPATGGPASSAPNTWVSARRAGLGVTAAVVETSVVGDGERAIRRRLTDEGVVLKMFPAARDRGLAVRWGVSWRLARWLWTAAPRADLVHAHGAWMFSTIVALLAAKMAGKPFALTPHESLTRRDVAWGATPLKFWIKRAVKRLLMRFTDLVVFASEIERRDSAEAGERGRREVIYHPVADDAAVLPLPRAVRPVPRPLTLGFLGRFDGKKNIELLLDVVAGLPDAYIQMAGGGPAAYERDLRARAERLGITGQVRWLGFIAAEARPAFFADIDILVMPSAYEGFGMVSAEALSHGVPVVVTDSSGIAELVAKYDCGIVARPDRRTIAEAIQTLAADPGRLARCSANALTMCRAELMAADYGSRLAGLYTKVLAQPFLAQPL